MSGAGGADGAKKRGAAAAYTLVEKMDVARYRHYMENRATNQDFPQRLGNKHPPAADGTVTQLIHCSHPGCKAKHKIVAASSGTEWTLWVADIPHVHDEALVKRERIPAAVKKELFDVAEIGKVTSGKAAFEALKVSNDQKRASGLPAFTDQELPSIKQVSNLMGARNRSIDQKGGSTKADFEKFARDFSWETLFRKGELSPDTPFVLACRTKEVFVTGTDVLNLHVQIVMSTRRLLSLVYDYFVRVVNADGTWKFTSEGAPALVWGWDDINGTYHVLAVGVSSTETEADYAWMMSQILAHAAPLSAEITHTPSLDHPATPPALQWKPKACLSDAAAAINNGIRKAVGGVLKWLVCFAHCVVVSVYVPTNVVLIVPLMTVTSLHSRFGST